MSLASNISLYSHTSLLDALNLPVSVAKDFFSGKPFGDWRKSLEVKDKTQWAIVERLNSVIRAICILAKTIARSNRA